MARDKKRKPASNTKRLRRWCFGLSAHYLNSRGSCLPCVDGDIKKPASIMWRKMDRQLTGWQWNWRVYVWADFSDGRDEWREDATIKPDKALRLTDLDDMVEREINQCKADGNERYLTDWGWCATILPDSTLKRRATVADRLERHIKKQRQKEV